MKNSLIKADVFIKKLVLTSVLIFSASAVFSVEVDENEIKSTSNQTIVFENYNGPHAKVDTLEQIRSIGSDLADGFNKDVPFSKGNADRYYVIHAIDSSEQGKLDADIFIIGKNSGVDHIRNLRHIIASYLSKDYGYEYDDAYTIATFATVYNAVYRNNIEYFKGKYKNDVLKNLDADKAGLALSYKQWAGSTQIVIPLADLNGGLSTIDTSVISDKKVVESMQEEDDKGIDQRKNMVDIKEREAEQASQKAQEAQKTATKEEEKLKEEKNILEQKKETAEQKKQAAQESQKKADEAAKQAQENPGDRQAQKQAEQAQKEAEQSAKEAEQAQKEADEQQETVEKQQETVNEAKNTAETEQAKADKKQTEAGNERNQIAKDQKEVITQQVLEETTAAYALKLVDTKNLYSAIVKINRLTGEELKTSPVTVIRNRTVYRDGTNFIAIAGETNKNGAVRLVQIDKDNLEIISESHEVIADNSVLIQAGSDYYCVINDNGKSYVGKFNSNLECTVKSSVEVNPATPIFISAEGFFVTDKSNKIITLNPSDLTKKM